MANPLFGAFGNNNSNPIMQLVNEARAFRQSFTGNPRAEVEKLLSSGKMTQQQFNQYSQIAQQVLQAMGQK